VEVECGDDDDSGEDDCFGDLDDGGGENSAERRAHHNALERKRRDHIKDSFEKLKESIPRISEKSTRSSRTEILKQATNYIRHIQNESASHSADISDLRRQNQLLEQQIRGIERSQSSGQFSSSSSNSSTTSNAGDIGTSEDFNQSAKGGRRDFLIRETSPTFSSSGSESGSSTSHEETASSVPGPSGGGKHRPAISRPSHHPPKPKRLKTSKK